MNFSVPARSLPRRSLGQASWEVGSDVPVRAGKPDMASKKKVKNFFAAGGGSTNVENAMVDRTMGHVLDDRFPGHQSIEDTGGKPGICAEARGLTFRCLGQSAFWRGWKKIVGSG